jgi:hypothetical protein
MTLRRKIYDLKGFFGIQWFLHRRLLIWLGVFMLAGICIGLITIFNPGVNAQLINRNLIDTNILNIVTPIPRASFGRFIAVRLIEFALFSSLIFLLCQTKITSLLAFVFVAFRTSTITINLYWILARLGIFGGTALFIFYLIFFLMLLTLLAVKTVYIMNQCAILRNYGFRRGICWRGFFKVMLAFACTAIFIAILEWLSFWLVFSQFLWPIVFPI